MGFLYIKIIIKNKRAYKIISKVLCTRLKRILPQIVSPTQGAFVARCLTSYNQLIAHEMVHGMKTNPN